MLTDRQRVELALPARMMWNAAVSAQVQSDIIDDLATACIEPLEGLAGKDRNKIARRIERAALDLTSPYVEKVTAGKMAMIIFYFTEALIKGGTLELYDGSPMAKAMEVFLPQLQCRFEIEAMDRSAQKQGIKLVERSKALGFYG